LEVEALPVAGLAVAVAAVFDKASKRRYAEWAWLNIELLEAAVARRGLALVLLRWDGDLAGHNRRFPRTHAV
jgi:hypothetical protein